MTLGAFTPGQYEVFDALCSRVAGRDGPGLASTELSDLGALTRELHAEDPNVDRIALLLERVGLEPDDLEELTTTTDDR